MSYVPAIGFVALWGLTALAVLIFAWIVYRAARGLSDSQITGTDKTDTLLGLAAACAISWPIFPWAGRTVTAIALYLTRGLPSALMPAFETTFQICGGDKSAECTKATLLAYTDNWTEATSNLIIRLGNELPYGWLVGFAILWIVAGQLLGAIRETEAERRPPLFRWLATTTRVQKLNGILIATLIVSLYLSIASIAAVPTLTESTDVPETSDAKSLEAKLDAKPPTLDPLVEKNPFGRLEEAIQNERAALQAQTKQGPVQAAQTAEGTALQPTAVPPAPAIDPAAIEARQKVLDHVQEALTEMKVVRESVIGNLRDMHAAVARGIDIRKSDALSVYQLNLKRIGARERDVHFLHLLNWYRTGNELAGNAFTACVSRAKTGDQSATSWAYNVESLLQRGGSEWTTTALRGAGAQRTFEHYYEAPCRSDLPFERAPERPPLGLGLGPFRLVAQWLLETESLSLALIVGMMGFGLLGSAVSTFVRETQGQERKEGEPLVVDLGGVILRGVSAAIVVFLGAKGGLTVFAGNASEPNPYVLLFTCLIGAVFSERVWDWAREKIVSSREERKPDEKPPENAAVPVELATPPATTPEPATP